MRNFQRRPLCVGSMECRAHLSTAAEMLSKIRTAQEEMGEEFLFEDQVRFLLIGHRLNVLLKIAAPSSKTGPPKGSFIGLCLNSLALSARWNWFKSSWKRWPSWKARVSWGVASPMRQKLRTRKRWTVHDKRGVFLILRAASLLYSEPELKLFVSICA